VTYQEIKDKEYPITLFAKGDTYKFFGLFNPIFTCLASKAMRSRVVRDG
jgi:hypothetical protein